LQSALVTAVFINFWYPVIEGSELGDEPLQVTMLGCDFVLFRDEHGKARCLANTCMHRGGSLGHGVVRDGCIQCPYHGWQYNGDGRCVRIPSIGRDGKIPARAKVDSYPVEERYGLVFAFLGDLPEKERPPIQTIVEWDQDDWRPTMVGWEFDANMERAVENSMDPAHNEFVHPTHGFQGEREDYRVPEMEVVEEELGAYFRIVMYSPAGEKGTLKESKREAGSVEAYSGHRGPNQLWNRLHLTDEYWLHQYQFSVPVNTGRTRFWHINMRNSWLDPKVDARMDERNRATAEQDQVVLKRLRPVVPPLGTSQELLMPSDEPVRQYRRYLAGWEAKGWRIDVDGMREMQKTATVTIPSPGRRDAGNWVLNTVPLVAPHEIPAGSSSASGAQ
jgi:phenylpropionate dioxygenase-like ring-hydroxylating dioxygenase large terminal subunit